MNEPTTEFVFLFYTNSAEIDTNLTILEDRRLTQTPRYSLYPGIEFQLIWGLHAYAQLMAGSVHWLKQLMSNYWLLWPIAQS